MKVTDRRIFDYLVFSYITCLIANVKSNDIHYINQIMLLFQQITSSEIDKKYHEEIERFSWKTLIKTKKELILYFVKLREKLDSSSLSLYTFNVRETLLYLKRECRSKNMTPRNPLLWGNVTWLLIHFLSLHYKESNSTKIVSIIHQIVFSLPCSICKNHGMTYLKKHKVPLHKKEFFDYFITFHNHVNKRNKKPIQININMKKCVKEFQKNQEFRINSN